MPLRNCDSYIKKFKLLESCFWILINHRKKLPACLYMLLPCACSRFWSLKKSKGSPYTCWLYIGTTVVQQNKFCNSFKSPKLSAQEDLTSSGSMIHASWESRCYLVSQVFFQTIFFLEWLKFIIYIVSLGTELGKLSKYGCLTMGIKTDFQPLEVLKRQKYVKKGWHWIALSLDSQLWCTQLRLSQKTTWCLTCHVSYCRLQLTVVVW